MLHAHVPTVGVRGDRHTLPEFWRYPQVSELRLGQIAVNLIQPRILTADSSAQVLERDSVERVIDVSL